MTPRFAHAKGRNSIFIWKFWLLWIVNPFVWPSQKDSKGSEKDFFSAFSLFVVRVAVGNCNSIWRNTKDVDDLRTSVRKGNLNGRDVVVIVSLSAPACSGRKAATTTALHTAHADWLTDHYPANGEHHRSIRLTGLLGWSNWIFISENVSQLGVGREGEIIFHTSHDHTRKKSIWCLFVCRIYLHRRSR